MPVVVEEEVINILTMLDRRHIRTLGAASNLEKSPEVLNDDTNFLQMPVNQPVPSKNEKIAEKVEDDEKDSDMSFIEAKLKELGDKKEKLMEQEKTLENESKELIAKTKAILS